MEWTPSWVVEGPKSHGWQRREVGDIAPELTVVGSCGLSPGLGEGLEHSTMVATCTRGREQSSQFFGKTKRKFVDELTKHTVEEVEATPSAVVGSSELHAWRSEGVTRSEGSPVLSAFSPG